MGTREEREGGTGGEGVQGKGERGKGEAKGHLQLEKEINDKM